MVVEGLGQGREGSAPPAPLGPQGPRLLPSGCSVMPQATVLFYGHCWLSTSKSEFWFMGRRENEECVVFFVQEFPQS